MKKIFILGASILQIPMICEAKKRGLYVYALDYDPKAAGIQYADEYLNVSTIDKKAVLEAAIKYSPDYIITSTSDMPVRTVAWVNEQLGKENGISYEDSIAATDKSQMRLRMQQCNVPIPQFYIVRSYDEFIDSVSKMPNKFIVKPADNAASRGVYLVNKIKTPDYKKIYDFSKQYSRSGVVLTEEFMTGPEVSVESLTINGETHIIAITDKIVTDEPFFVELGHTEPSRLSDNVQNDIKNVAVKAIEAIGIKNGPSHTEIKVTPDGAKLVEIAARLGGDFITSKLVPLSTGVDMTRSSLNIAIGEEPSVVSEFSNGAAIRFIYGSNGILERIEGVENAKSIPGVAEVKIYKKNGEAVSELRNSSDRLGHIIAVGKNADEASDICERAFKFIQICMK